MRCGAELAAIAARAYRGSGWAGPSLCTRPWLTSVLASMLAVVFMGGGGQAVGRASAAQHLPTVGVLASSTQAGWAAFDAAFRAGLAETGYVDGQNVTLVERYTGGGTEQIPALDSELVGLGVDVLVSMGGRPSHVAAKQATTTIPVVVATADAVLASELNSGTGSNVTGILFWSAELGDKRLELLQATIPGLKGVAVLRDPSVPNTLDRLEAMQAVAAQHQLEVIPVQAQSADELGTALDAASQAGANALLVIATPLFFDNSTQLGDLAIQHRLPTMYESSATAGQAGLMWYGQNLTDDFRRAGVYTGRLLDGAKPSDLPWLEPQVFDVGINLDTARRIGLEVPPAVLAQATQVIGQAPAPLVPAQVP